MTADARRPSVYDLRRLREQRTITQIYTDCPDEARAAAEAGIDIIVSALGPGLADIIAAAPATFITAGIRHGAVVSKEDALRAGFGALDLGASAVYCASRLQIVEAMSLEGIPVVGHIGLVPSHATWTNYRAIGNTFNGAVSLFQQTRDLENAGAFAAEFEVMPVAIATEISKRTSLITLSMGSGSGCDGQYLFACDILGENRGHVPKHAKVYRNLAAERDRLQRERVKALEEFVEDVNAGLFPESRHVVEADAGMVERFVSEIELERSNEA